MKQNIKIKTGDIAPCGMNCAVCYGYLREKNRCPGCRSMDGPVDYCRKCIIRNCLELKKGRTGFCYTCGKFPCKRLKSLDYRYRKKYGMSMIENLSAIKENGVRAFVKAEKRDGNVKNAAPQGRVCLFPGLRHLQANRRTDSFVPVI
ncbi:MAG: DUF3795 domain-containing protein [Candidatus Goldiibacteriota bacterium]